MGSNIGKEVDFASQTNVKRQIVISFLGKLRKYSFVYEVDGLKADSKTFLTKLATGKSYQYDASNGIIEMQRKNMIWGKRKNRTNIYVLILLVQFTFNLTRIVIAI